MADTPADILDVVINISTSTTTTLVAAVTGKRIKVWGIWVQSAGTQTMKFQDGTPTILIPVLDFAARERLVVQQQGNFSYPWFTTVIGAKLDVVTTQAVQLSGRLYYSQGDN